MSAATLRAAASLLRERAEAATPGPWFVEEVGDFGEKSASLPIGRWRGMTDNVSFGEDFATAAHIAALHPAVARALADWLDSEARDRTGSIHERAIPSAALALARTYLGEQS